MFVVLMFIGGCGAVMLTAILVERILFQRIFDDPAVGKLASVVCAWLIVATIVSLLLTGGQGLLSGIYGLYFPVAIAVGLWAYHRGRQLRAETPGPAQDAELQRTFE